MSQEKSGYPSIDKPWLKYYSEEAIHAARPECTAYELIKRNNYEHPNDIALIYYSRKFTYNQIFQNIENTAKAFTALNISPGDIVILCMVNIPETVFALYALNRLGAIANLADPRTNEEQLHDYILECGAKLIVTIDLAYPVIKDAAKNTPVKTIITVSPADSLSPINRIHYNLKNKSQKLEKNTLRWNEFIAAGVHTTVTDAPYEKNRCFLIAHTGGTTGIPKGVMLSDDNINAVAHGYQYLDIPFQRQHKYFNDLPPFIIYGLALAIHTTLCYGLQVILYPKFDSKGFPKLFAKYKPHHFSALADHLKYLSEDPLTKNMDLSFLISPGVGGDFLNAETEQEVNAYLKRNGCQFEITKGYGMTELCATSVISFRGANAIGSVGVPLVSNTVKIVDIDTNQELKYNQIGEVWISAPSAMLGYYKKPEETAAVFVTDEKGISWIRTGDLGRINEDGLLFLEGRIRRIYLTAFEGQPAKIFPTLIESILKETPEVYDCTVVARHMHESVYYEPVAYVILKANSQPSDTLVDKLKSICANSLPSYMLPVEYQFVTEFPHTPIGKIDFKALESLAAKDTQ